MQGEPQELESELNDSQSAEVDAFLVGRYFDASEGSELDTTWGLFSNILILKGFFKFGNICTEQYSDCRTLKQ